MAPEQFGGRSVPASDLYGLGATLIYLVTGLHPTELSHQDFKIQFCDRVAHLNPSLIDWLEWMTEPSLEKRLSSAGEALRSLKNPRPINKSPMVVQPPPGSDIKLTKNSEFIEIVIPPQGIGFGLIALLSAAVPASIFLLPGVFSTYVSTYNSEINHQFMLISVSVFLGAVGVMFLFAIFRKLRLRIDDQQISYSSDILGLRWNNSKAAPRPDICQLESEQIGYKVSQLIIQSGNQEYRLGKKQGLSKSEIEWLATELSQWLGVKIKRTLTDKADEWFC